MPLAIVVALTFAYGEFSRLAPVAGALRGMGAIAAGLVIATALKLMTALGSSQLGRPLAGAFATLTFVDHRLAALAAGLGDRRPRLARGRDRLSADAMTPLVHATLSHADLLGLFAHFLVLSLLAVGGAITTAPDMHRYVVDEHQWISDAQFSASVAIAQAAPGPNVLFVAVIGWNVAGPIGALATMSGTLLPSTALTLVATRWGTSRRETRGMRAFTTGLTPAHHRPAGRDRLGAGTALRRRRPARVRRDRPDRRRDRGDDAHTDQPDVAGRTGCARRRAGLGLRVVGTERVFAGSQVDLSSRSGRGRTSRGQQG